MYSWYGGKYHILQMYMFAKVALFFFLKQDHTLSDHYVPKWKSVEQVVLWQLQIIKLVSWVI